MQKGLKSKKVKFLAKPHTTHCFPPKAKKKNFELITAIYNFFENPYLHTIFSPFLAHCKMRVTHFLNSQTSPTLIMLLERFLHAYFMTMTSAVDRLIYFIFTQLFRRPRLECVVFYVLKNIDSLECIVLWQYFREVFVQISSFLEYFF